MEPHAANATHVKNLPNTIQKQRCYASNQSIDSENVPKRQSGIRDISRVLGISQNTVTSVLKKQKNTKQI
jgi:hypothetical protein